MPMLHARRDPDGIARSDFLDPTTFSLHQANALRDDKSLTKRMGVPSGARPRFEGDGGAADAGFTTPLEAVVELERSR